MSPYHAINQGPPPDDTGRPINGDWIAAHQEENLAAAIGPHTNLYLETILKHRGGDDDKLRMDKRPVETIGHEAQGDPARPEQGPFGGWHLQVRIRRL